MKHRIAFALAVLVGLSLQFTARAKVFEGVVSHVTDGDTLWLQVASYQKPVKIRLQGIDAPESCQTYGAQAQQALRQLVLHQVLQVNTRAIDPYGRALGKATVGGRHGAQDVGAWLVRNGHAWSYHHRRSAGPYAHEEAAARAQRLGLWQDSQAIEPRVFRKQRGSCKK